MSAETFNCRKCDAIVESPSGNALVVCASCGEPYPSSNIADVPVSLIPSQSSELIAEAVKRQLSDSRHMKGAPITIESVEGVYVPIFITKTTFQGTWIGYHTVPLFTTGGGGEPGPDANTVWSSGSVDETTDYPLIASISATQFGVELIHRTLFNQQPVDLSDVDWNAVENTILPIGIDTSQLNQILKEQIIQDEQNRVLKETRTTILTKFDVEVDFHDRCIVYVPFWTVHYRHKQRVYRAAVSGGDGKVLALTEPVLLTSKLGLWVQSTASLAGAGFIVETSLPVVVERWEWDAFDLSRHKGNEGDDILFIHMLLVVFCWYMSLSVAKKQPADTRIKRIGEPEELVVFSQTRSTLHRPELLMVAVTAVFALGFRLYGTIGILAPLLILCMGATTIRRIVSSSSQLQASEEEYVQNPKPALMTYGQLAVENRLQLSND
jgi:hypothetical protein